MLLEFPSQPTAHLCQRGTRMGGGMTRTCSRWGASRKACQLSGTHVSHTQWGTRMGRWEEWPARAGLTRQLGRPGQPHSVAPSSFEDETQACSKEAVSSSWGACI